MTNSLKGLFSYSPWGRFGAAKNAIQTRTPMTEPLPKPVALDHMMMVERMNDITRSPMNDAVMPSNMPLRFPGSILMPSNAIQGLANSAGENQIAPRTHRMTAETRIARLFKEWNWSIDILPPHAQWHCSSIHNQLGL